MIFLELVLLVYLFTLYNCQKLNDLQNKMKKSAVISNEWLFIVCLYSWCMLCHVITHLKASIRRSTFCASPWTRIWAWNFRKASSSSITEKSSSSTTQLQQTNVMSTHACCMPQLHVCTNRVQENCGVFIYIISGKTKINSLTGNKKAASS